MKAGAGFLNEIVRLKRTGLARTVKEHPVSEVSESAYLLRSKSRPHALLAALRQREGLAVIAEIKRASPSQGEIRGGAEPVEMGRIFEENGATAISVLTEENFFRGSLDDLRAVKNAVSIPVLRKDFILDAYQVFESAAAGADALLLITAALDDDALYDLRKLTEDQLGMDALVEVHTLEELRRARRCKARLIGVNNRNLHTFEVSLDVSTGLIKEAAADAAVISESGLRTNADLERLRSLGFGGFLVGEMLMRAEDPGAALRELLGRAS